MDPVPSPAPDDSPGPHEVPSAAPEPTPAAPVETPGNPGSQTATPNDTVVEAPDSVSPDRHAVPPESFLLVPDEPPEPPKTLPETDDDACADDETPGEGSGAASLIPEDFLLVPDEAPGSGAADPVPAVGERQSTDDPPAASTVSDEIPEDLLPRFPEEPLVPDGAEPVSDGGATEEITLPLDASAGPSPIPEDPLRLAENPPEPPGPEPVTAGSPAGTGDSPPEPEGAVPARSDGPEADAAISPPASASVPETSAAGTAAMEAVTETTATPTPGQAVGEPVADAQRSAVPCLVPSGPAGGLHRVKTLFRNQPRAFLAAIAAAVLLATGLVVVIRQNFRVKDAVARMIEAEKVAQSQTALRRQAEEEADRSRRIAAFVTGMLRDIGPSVAAGRDTALLREVMERAAHRVKADFAAQPSVEGELCLALSQVCFELGDYERSEAMGRRALELREPTLGKDHPGVSLAQSSLALASLKNGRAAEAEALLREVMTARRAALGPDHPDIATIALNLSVALRQQRKFEEAEKLAREGLAIRRKLPPAQSRLVLSALTNLADLLLHMNRLSEAEAVSREAVETHARSSEARVADPDLAGILTGLAAVLRQRRDLVGAERVMRDALDIRLKILGPENLNVAWARSQLAMVLMHQGRHREAEPLMREALALRRKLLGNQDRQVMESLSNLGAVLLGLGDLQGAETNFHQALDMGRATLGPKHEIVTNLINSLAVVQARRGNLAGAESGFREALAVQRQALGDTHPQVASSMDNLARILEEQRKTGEAAAVWREFVTAQKKGAGPDRTAQIRVAMEAGAFFCRHGLPAEAEPLLRDCLANLMRDEPGGWRRFAAEAMLGGSLMEQGKLAEALPLLVAGSRGLRQQERDMPPERLAEIPIALNRLVRLGELTGKPADQAVWKGELEDFYSRHPTLRPRNPPAP